MSKRICRTGPKDSLRVCTSQSISTSRRQDTAGDAHGPLESNRYEVNYPCNHVPISRTRAYVRDTTESSKQPVRGCVKNSKQDGRFPAYLTRFQLCPLRRTNT